MRYPVSRNKSSAERLIYEIISRPALTSPGKATAAWNKEVELLIHHLSP